MSEGGKKRKWGSGGHAGKRAHYATQASLGCPAILFTCFHNQQKSAIREAYNLLEEYADQIFGPQGEQSEDEGADSSSLSVEEQIAAEVAQLQKNKKANNSRFSMTDTGCKGVVMIRVKDAKLDPTKLVVGAVDDMTSTKVAKSRYLIRFVPIQHTCYARIQEITSMTKPILSAVFGDEANQKPACTWAIKIKKRNCDAIQSIDIINCIGGMVEAGGPHKVDLTNADKVIVIEVCKNVCGISIFDGPKFRQLKEFNLRALTEAFTCVVEDEDEKVKKKIAKQAAASAAKAEAKGEKGAKEGKGEKKQQVEGQKAEEAKEEDKEDSGGVAPAAKKKKKGGNSLFRGGENSLS
jgi:tRNA acetyltransferase TAN1